MWLDGELNTKPPGSTLQNKNVNTSKNPGVCLAEPGTLLLGNLEKLALGNVQLPDNTKLLFLKPDTLVIVKDEQYTVFATGSFNITKPIIGVAGYNNRNEIVVVWADGGPLKYLNLSHIPTVITEESINLNVYDLVATVNTSIVSGVLPSGTYYPMVQGVNEEGTTTAWVVGKPIRIFDTFGGLDELEGSSSGTPTRTGIRVEVAGQYSTYNYGYIYVRDGEKFVYNLGKAGSTFTITGSENKQTITLEEALLGRAFYKNVGLVEKLGNILYIGELEYYEDDDIQQLLEGVTVKWTSTLVNTDTLKLNTQEAGFMPGEVYALYLRAKYPWGRGVAFPLIGRSRLSTDGTGNAFRSTDTCKLDGTLSYWENEDEFYPDEARWGTLRNTKVRHHKLPSLNWLKTNLYPTDNSVGTFRLPRLSFTVSNIPTLPGSTGWELCYAERTPNNSLVLGQTPTLHSIIDAGLGPNDIINNIYSLGANIMIPPTGLHGFPTTGVEGTFFRLYPFELMLGAGAIPKNFRREYKLTATPTTLNTKLRRQPGEPTQENFDKLNIRYYGLIDYKFGTVATVTPTELTGLMEYLPKDVYYKRISNHMLENTYILKFDSPGNELDVPPTITAPTLIFSEQTYLITLLTANTNVYKSFDKQNLVVAGSNNTYTGDCYITDYTFHTYGKKRSNDENYQLYDAGLIFARRLAVYSRHPIALRRTVPGSKPYTNYYPKENVGEYTDSWMVDVEPNGFVNSINRDFSVLNDIYPPTFYDPKRQYKNPYWIARSQVYQSIDNWFGWRDFRLADVMIMPSDKGRMTNLVSIGDLMYIHFEHNLYITRGGEELQLVGKKVTYVGSGDVFVSPPEEVLHDKYGSLGLKHFCQGVITPYGYIFADTISNIGAIYLVSGKTVKVLSDNGMISFFRDNLLDVPTESGRSITVQYDSKYKRVFVLNKGLLPRNRGKYKGEYYEGMILQAGDIVYKDNKFVTVSNVTITLPVEPPEA